MNYQPTLQRVPTSFWISARAFFKMAFLLCRCSKLLRTDIWLEACPDLASADVDVWLKLIWHESLCLSFSLFAWLSSMPFIRIILSFCAVGYFCIAELWLVELSRLRDFEVSLLVRLCRVQLDLDWVILVETVLKLFESLDKFELVFFIFLSAFLDVGRLFINLLVGTVSA